MSASFRNGYFGKLALPGTDKWFLMAAPIKAVIINEEKRFSARSREVWQSTINLIQKGRKICL
nr:hypothetical protein [uncultured bacterium]